MDDFGMMMISEDDLDSMFNPQPEMPSNLTEGRNIKTGCYGLFLCALDECQDNMERSTLQEAIDVLENIHGCTAFCALSMYYPPDVINYTSILSLSEAFILLNDRVGHKHAEDIDNDSIETLERDIESILTVREGFEYLNEPQVDENAPTQLNLFEDIL